MNRDPIPCPEPEPIKLVLTLPYQVKCTLDGYPDEYAAGFNSDNAIANWIMKHGEKHGITVDDQRVEKQKVMPECEP
jgi:hypothetical protein